MSPSTYGLYYPIGNVMTTFLTNPQQQRHSGPRQQQVDYNESRMEGVEGEGAWGGSQVVAWVSYWSVKQEHKGGAGLQGVKRRLCMKTWLFRWLIVTLELLNKSNNEAGIYTKIMLDAGISWSKTPQTRITLYPRTQRVELSLANIASVGIPS